MSNETVALTRLDEILQQMARENWQQFAALLGPEAIRQAKTCLLRNKGKSYGEIGIALGEKQSNVRHWCAKCDSK